jgi:dCMP deaminase
MTHTRPPWDLYFLDIVAVVATRADCRRRQVGCVIVDTNRRIISTGYNGAPAGDPGCLSGACPRGLLNYDEVKEFTDYDSGPGKCISLHAEANALLYAGQSCRGATAYITDAPCPTCTKLLKGAGIVRVVHPGCPEGYYLSRPGYIRRQKAGYCMDFQPTLGLYCELEKGHYVQNATSQDIISPHQKGEAMWMS